MNLQQILQSMLGSNPNNVDNSPLNILTGGVTRADEIKFAQQHPTLNAMAGRQPSQNLPQPPDPQRLPETVGVQGIAQAVPQQVQSQSQVQQPLPTNIQPTPQSAGAQQLRSIINEAIANQPARVPYISVEQKAYQEQNAANPLTAPSRALTQDEVKAQYQAMQPGPNEDQLAHSLGIMSKNDLMEAYKKMGNNAPLNDRELATIQGYNPDIAGMLKQRAENAKPGNLYQNLLRDEFNKVTNRNSYDYNPARALDIAKQLDTLTNEQTKQQQAITDKQTAQEGTPLDKLKIAAELEKQRIASEGTYNVAKAKAEEEALKEQKKQENASKGKALPAGSVSALSDLSTSINLLKDFNDNIKAIKDPLLFTPLIGETYTQLASATGNPDAKKYLSQITLLKQIIGKGLEGGVLRAEDTKKYNDILGSPGATKDQLTAIGDEIATTLKSKLHQHVLDYGLAGYNVSGFSPKASVTNLGTQEVNAPTTAVNENWAF